MFRQLPPGGDERSKVGVSERRDDMLDDMLFFFGQAPFAASPLQKGGLGQVVK